MHCAAVFIAWFPKDFLKLNFWFFSLYIYRYDKTYSNTQILFGIFNVNLFTKNNVIELLTNIATVLQLKTFDL